MQQWMSRYAAPVGLFFGSLFLFTWGLQSQEVISFDSRFYLFALEMYRHGITWFPTTYLQPYPDYTVASTFLIYLCATLFGGLTKLTAVLPSAIAAALVVVLTYLIGELRQKRWGWYAVAFLLLTVTFIKSARGVALDMYPCLLATACFYLLYSASVLHHAKRRLWIYPLFILGFIFRGPIGLVIPTGVACIYFLLDRDIRKLLITGFVAFTLLILCTIALLYLAYRVGGVPFMQDVFRMQIGSRIDSQFLPFYFYFYNSFLSYALTYPFALLVILSLFYYRKKLHDYSVLIKLTGWALVILIGMSVPGEKKVRYVLAMAPALALLAAYPLALLPRQKYLVWLRHVTILFLFLLPSLFLLTAVYLGRTLPSADLLISVSSGLLTFFGTLQIANIVLYFTATPAQRFNAILIVALISYFMAYFKVVEPIELKIDSGRDFVSYVELRRQQQHARLVFYRIPRDGLPIKYLINMEHEESPIFLNTPDELDAYHARAFFITKKSDYAALTKKQKANFTVVATGKLGHVELLVVTR